MDVLTNSSRSSTALLKFCILLPKSEPGLNYKTLHLRGSGNFKYVEGLLTHMRRFYIHCGLPCLVSGRLLANSKRFDKSQPKFLKQKASSSLSVSWEPCHFSLDWINLPSQAHECIPLWSGYATGSEIGKLRPILMQYISLHGFVSCSICRVFSTYIRKTQNVLMFS